jgi:predicted metalloprotease with PDZ domain
MRAMHPLRYRIAVPAPERHLAEIELTIDDAAAFGDTVRLEMAAWCPGSYLIRDYARYVRDLEVRGDDRPLEVVQVDKRTWEVARGGARTITVRYAVYGHELTVRTNHIDATHALLHGPALYLWPSAARDAAYAVELAAPAGWAIHTGLPVAAAGGHVAAGVDQLLDCPIHLGAPEERRRTAGGKPLTLAVWGAPRNARYDLDRLADDLAAICQRHIDRMGGAPYVDYTFVLMLAPGAYGGLEHATSSINLHTPFALATAKGYGELLELLSHEYFHAWNGKRLFPQRFERFDYGKENETRALWVVEGLTSYFDRLTVRLADRVPVAGYLGKLAEEWGRLLAVPGRRRHSLEASSFNAWQKLYKPDESNLNTTVSYYLKGGLVALALDLELRRRSAGVRTLDDVVRAMWRAYAEEGRGYPEDLQPVVERAAELELGEFFARYVRGTEDPPLPALLDGVGLALRSGHEARSDEAGDPAWLGLFVQGGTLRIAAVPDEGPAAAAGLGPGDDLLALDRYQIASEADLRQRLGGYRPGARAEVAVFRRGRLETLEVELGVAPHARHEVVAGATLDDARRAAFAAWLGAEHPGPRLAASATVSVGV